MFNRLKTWLLVLFLAPLVALFVLLASPILIFLVLRDWRQRRQFRRENSDKVFFVCSRRHDWEPFLVNNVLPVVADEQILSDSPFDQLNVYWAPNRQHKQTELILRLSPSGLPKPYLIHFHPDGDQLIEMHDDLLEYKPLGKGDLQTQLKVRELLINAIQSLQFKQKEKLTSVTV